MVQLHKNAWKVRLWHLDVAMYITSALVFMLTCCRKEWLSYSAAVCCLQVQWTTLCLMSFISLTQWPAQPAWRLKAIFLLTAKFKVSCSANDGSTAVDGQTLVWACVSTRVGAANHQVAGHQRVTEVQAKWYFSAIHKPSANQNVIKKLRWGCRQKLSSHITLTKCHLVVTI